MSGFKKILWWLAEAVNRFPSQQMRIIAVVGPKGKTTTAVILSKIMSVSGGSVASLSSLDMKEESWQKILSPFAFQRYLKQLCQGGFSDLIIEIPTEMLESESFFFPINFAAVVQAGRLDSSPGKFISGLTRLIGSSLNLFILNADSRHLSDVLALPAEYRLTYGLDQPSLISAKKLYSRPIGTDFVLVCEGRQASMTLPLPGLFQVENALAAATAAIGLGLPIETIFEGLRQVEPVPGRLEVIDRGQLFTVILDQACSPDDLATVFQVVRPLARGRLVAVIGASGGRSPLERPIIGATAGRLADYVIVTTQNPGPEDPATLIDQVAAGVPRGRPRRGRLKIKREQTDLPVKYRDSGEDIWWWRVAERRLALMKAFELARPQDVVVITGLGAAESISHNQQKIDWSDRRILDELLKPFAVN